MLWFVADPGDVSVAVRSQAAAARYKPRSCPGAETARAAHPVDGEEHAVNLLCYIKKGKTTFLFCLLESSKLCVLPLSAS